MQRNPPIKAIVDFCRLFSWFSLRHMRRHMGRAATVLLGIALGAAVFTCVRIAVHASLQSFTNSMEAYTGQADQVLFRPGGYLDEKILATVLRQPEVAAASALLTTYVRRAGKDEDAFLLIGLDPILDRHFRHWRAGEGEKRATDVWLDLIRSPNTLVLGRPLAQKLGLTAGSRLSLENPGGEAVFKVLGVLESDGLAVVEGGRIALADIATVQEFTNRRGQVERIDLQLRSGVSDSVLNRLQEMLPGGVSLDTPSAARDSGEGMIRAYQLNLSILSFASLFVGMFLVYSLVALNAASRRKELAVLRSIGASPRTLLAIFLSEGGVLGGAGWLLAIPVGAFLVNGLLDGISKTVGTLFVRGVYVDRLVLSPWELFLSLLVTIGISVLAAGHPAREAMQVSPKEVIEVAPFGRLRPIPQIWLVVPGITLIALVVPVARLPAIAGIPLAGYLAILALFVGFALLAPLLLQRLGKWIAPHFRRHRIISAYLAGRYVRDSGARTSISVGALITAVALFVSLVIMIHSFRETVELWVNQTISGDLFVTTKMGGVNRFRYPIAERDVALLKDLSAGMDIVPSRRYQLSYSGFKYEFEALGMEPFLKRGGFVWLEGDPERLAPEIVNGDGVLVSEVFANRTGLATGDLFSASIDGSLVKLPVLGIVRDYRTDGGAVFYAWDAFKRRYHDPRWSGARFYLPEGESGSAAAVEALRARIAVQLGDRVDMITGFELRAVVLRIFDETFAVTIVLLLIALVVAALGITTTLTVLVLERSRQLNTLLAVGASFRQIRAMILWEAAFLVTAGEIAGLACGFILSYVLIFVINRQSFGWTFLYGVDWASLAMSVPLIVLTALVAAIPAVRMVFREPPATLLRER